MHVISAGLSVTLHSIEEIDLEARELLTQAIHVRRNAQMPYSSYRVGAALSTAGHSVHVGCNVERRSHSQTTHAEQNAIDTMVAKDGAGTKISAIAFIAAPAQQEIAMPHRTDTDPPADLSGIEMPCGHCRHCIWENSGKDPSVRIITMLPDRWIAITTIGDIYPMPF